MTRQRYSEQAAQRVLPSWSYKCVCVLGRECRTGHLIFRIANLLPRVSVDCSVRATKVQVFFITSTIINVALMARLSDEGLLS